MCSVGEILIDCGSMCPDNVTVSDTVYRRMIQEVSGLLPQLEYHPWLMSAIGSVVVGLSGIFPLLIIPADEGMNLKNGAGARTLKVLLSFAVGGLLGDVFLHLLPEAWASRQQQDPAAHPSMSVGAWVLAGLLVFIIVEKVFSFSGGDEDDEGTEAAPIVARATQVKQSSSLEHNNNTVSGKDTAANGKVCRLSNRHISNGPVPQLQSLVTQSPISNRVDVSTAEFVTAEQNVKSGKNKQVAGYLNLMANSIDNFTHGLAVGGSFLISFRMGALSTLAILVHEIPHEVGDFAILLRAGFTRWEAAQAQLLTAFAGLMGAMVAVVFSEAGGSVEAKTSWILPFTAGGFLHIALVTVLPELLQEKDPWESLKQMSSLMAGIIVMAVLTVLVE